MTLLRPSRAEQRAVTFEDVWGTGADVVRAGTLAGEKVDFATVIGLDAVAAAVGLKSDIVSMLPAHGYRDVDGVATRLPKTPVIIAKPSPRVTAMAWKAQAVMSWALWGNVYGLVLARDGLGYPTSIELLDPAQVNVVEHPPAGTPEYWYAGRQVDNDDMVHVPGRFMRPGSIVGIPPLENFRETWGLAAAARNYGARWFGEGGHPTGVLTTDKRIEGPNADEAMESLKAKFKRLMRGSSRETLVLSQGLKYTQVQQGPAASQMLETQRHMVGAVARAIGMPAEMIGGAPDGGSITYANREQRSLDLLAYYVDPDVTRLEDLWTACLPRPQYSKVNRGALLRTDLLTRYRAHDLSLRGGWENRDAIRALEDKPPIEDGTGGEHLWPPYATSVQQIVPSEGS